MIDQRSDQPLAQLVRYTRWATLRLIDACLGLTDEQLATRAPGTSGSIAELPMHLVGQDLVA
jgi:uncharacterized damage-inducible protein DinB